MEFIKRRNKVFPTGPCRRRRRRRSAHNSTFDSFASAVSRGFVEQSVQQPVQPRMHFLLAAPVREHVCAHRFGGFNRRACYTLSQNFTATHDRTRARARAIRAAYLLSGATTPRKTSIISKTQKKISRVNCYRAGRKLSVSFALS